jgi:lathosterol oxidase
MLMFHIPLYIISYDIWFYISHILLHKVHCLKLIHKKHHELNYQTIRYSDTYVGHYLEGPFQSIGVIVPMFFIESNIYEYILVVLFLNLRGMIRHVHRLTWIYGNHHIIHHKYPNYNYGEYWLDCLFGTNYPDNKNE